MHLILFCCCECVADAECRETLQAIAHFLLPALFCLFWFSLVVTVPCFLQKYDHPRSQRHRERLRLRYRPVSWRYHRWKRRHKWKRKRSFRMLGRRHLGMRGDDRLIITNRAPPWLSMGGILFLTYKLVCMVESAVRRILSWLPFRPRAVAFAAKSSRAGRMRFDSDSFTIGVDTHASRTLSSRKECFKDLKPCSQGFTCDGFTDKKGSGASIAGIGTFCFQIEDDDGGYHIVEIPNSLYIEGATVTLLSPQHWAQVANDHYPEAKGTAFEGDDEGVTLFWQQRQFKKTVRLNPSTNTPGFQTAAGSRAYRCFAAAFQDCDAFDKPLEQVDHLPPDIQRQRGNNDDSIGDEHLLAPPHVIPPDPTPSDRDPPLGDHYEPPPGRPPDDGSQKQWSRTDRNAKCHRTTNAEGPDWSLVSRRVTVDTDRNEVIEDLRVDAGVSDKHLHRALPAGVRNIKTILYYSDSECAPVSTDSRGRVRMGPLTFDPSKAAPEDVQPEPQAADAQAELLRWHYRLGHLPFSKLKKLAEIGEIPRHLRNVVPPVCAACLFGAMTKVPWKSKPSTTEGKEEVFKATAPGQCVSVDQMVSTQVGFLAQMKGKLTNQRYTGVTIFVDHYSRARYIHLMRTDLTSEETIEAKEAFERWAASHGVVIQHYHCDNGRFADNAFKAHCDANRQRISYCGVNAHFQNGIAERAIRDLQEQARKQLFHAKSRWPSVVDLSLWPYAMRSTSNLHNVVPELEGGTSRMELFTGVKIGAKMRHMHVFGCPVYALRNELASGGSIPKWSPRCRLGLNLGPSPNHARNVYLVLSLTTGLVSPQFHVKFDDLFETTRLQPEDTLTGSAPTWKSLAGFVKVQRMPELLPNFHHESEASPSEGVSASKEDHPEPAEAEMPPEEEVVGETQGGHFGGEEPPPLRQPRHSANHRHQAARREETSSSADAPVDPPVTTSSRGRIRRPTQRLMESTQQRDIHGKKGYYVSSSAQVLTPDQAHDQHLDLQERMRHPIAFHAEMMGDTMYYHQAMKQSDAAEFEKAVVKEVNGHVENKHWTLIKRKDVPKDQEVIPSVWAMRRKRNLITNEVTKYKARLNIHGGMQTFGVNYYETYAPVVTWFAIRLLIVFAILFSWSLKQVDFVMAYPQAPIETDMYMDLPHGITTVLGHGKDHVLKLSANLYGQKQAGRVWNHHLVSKLRSIGFVPSKVDECVFYRGTTIFVVYVDDGLCIDPSQARLNRLVKEINDTGLKIEDQGHPADYIGVNIRKDSKGYYHFSQLALIDAIIDDVGLTHSRKVKPVPAKVSVRLHAFQNSPVFDGSFGFRSAVGKINYLAQTTRPDILMAIHQIAKYSHDPRKEHGEAIIYLVMYLKGTRHIGLYFKPDPTKGFEDYCDSDFAGNWNKHFAHNDPSTAKSRSGWIVFYAGCPIIFGSSLQSMVALSTTEAEYIALSRSLRDVIPIMELVAEMKAKKFQVVCTEPYVYCKTFEDNSGALELARLPKLRPRTKHINTSYHHFREHVRKGLVKVFPISTHDQIADCLNKALPQNAFVKHRIKMCGQ